MSPEHPPRTRSILVIGAGELGSAILHALISHPRYNPQSTSITLLVRPATLSNPSPEKSKQQSDLRALGIILAPGDVESSEEELTTLFRPYSSVIHAGGMALPPGSLLKLTRAILAADVQYYVPWQHGVDYDAITRRGGQGMFAEKIDVRDLLRSQSSTQWVVLSCGVFMSFLFQEFWGVVLRLPDGKVQTTALNSWDDVITTTTAEDIARCTAELMYNADTPVNRPVYIAGDTLTYGQFAEVVGRAMGREVVRQVWPLEYLRKESQKDPVDKIKRYRVVFAEGKGLSWPKEETWSAKHGMDLMGVEEWVRRNFA
ncbi:hypothetical protein PV05_06304 [Exophiala xenobiotica]|uniref:NmrA-like domain-containing protein n=1 Tax=Exophiala xenobiotica TaxID=348802 RepID=A0A0D2EH20_9EURO|nr:uncharacterized protein PV05_06304 [Exophiala xenobiotica]KIW53895.1 hypothetical protein PV05_06304 [Exophiala xenobiotica]